MNAKFKPNEKVLFNGEERAVVVATKNFSTNEISYLLDNQQTVSEKELTAVKSKVVPPPAVGKPVNPEPIPGIEALRARYIELTGKEISNAKKNDAEWLKSKIEEKEAELEAEAAHKKKYEQYYALKALSVEQMVEFAEKKGVTMDPEDYADGDQMLIALCEELEVEVPEVE